MQCGQKKKTENQNNNNNNNKNIIGFSTSLQGGIINSLLLKRELKIGNFNNFFNFLNLESARTWTGTSSVWLQSPYLYNLY
jgi:hypothetical protein